MANWIAPFKVVLYDDDGAVAGETPVDTEEEGQALIASVLVDVLNAGQDGEPPGDGLTVPSPSREPQA